MSEIKLLAIANTCDEVGPPLLIPGYILDTFYIHPIR